MGHFMLLVSLLYKIWVLKRHGKFGTGHRFSVLRFLGLQKYNLLNHRPVQLPKPISAYFCLMERPLLIVHVARGDFSVTVSLCSQERQHSTSWLLPLQCQAFKLYKVFLVAYMNNVWSLKFFHFIHVFHAFSLTHVSLKFLGTFLETLHQNIAVWKGNSCKSSLTFEPYWLQEIVHKRHGSIRPHKCFCGGRIC